MHCWSDLALVKIEGGARYLLERYKELAIYLAWCEHLRTPNDFKASHEVERFLEIVSDAPTRKETT